MIHGLTDRKRLPRIGKIRLGIKAVTAGGKEYPKAVDYFVCPPAVQKVYGEKPKSIDVIFVSDDPDVNFPHELKAYRQSGLYCAGDRREAKRWAEGQLVTVPCPCDLLEKGECKPNATLNFMLPKVQGLGVWQLVTGSTNSIRNILGAFDMYSAMFGGIMGIPFRLEVQAQKIQRPDKEGKMVSSTIHVLALLSDMSTEQLMDLRRRQGKPIAMLPPASTIDAEDAHVINGEAEAEAHAQEDAEAEWDISMCFKKAAEIGVDASDYTDYLFAVYKTDLDNLPESALAQQRTFLEDADEKTTAPMMRTLADKARKMRTRLAGGETRQ